MYKKLIKTAPLFFLISTAQVFAAQKTIQCNSKLAILNKVGKTSVWKGQFTFTPKLALHDMGTNGASYLYNFSKAQLNAAGLVVHKCPGLKGVYKVIGRTFVLSFNTNTLVPAFWEIYSKSFLNSKKSDPKLLKLLKNTGQPFILVGYPVTAQQLKSTHRKMNQMIRAMLPQHARAFSRLVPKMFTMHSSLKTAIHEYFHTFQPKFKHSNNPFPHASKHVFGCIQGKKLFKQHFVKQSKLIITFLKSKKRKTKKQWAKVLAGLYALKKSTTFQQCSQALNFCESDEGVADHISEVAMGQVLKRQYDVSTILGHLLAPSPSSCYGTGGFIALAFDKVFKSQKWHPLMEKGMTLQQIYTKLSKQQTATP